MRRSAFIGSLIALPAAFKALVGSPPPPPASGMEYDDVTWKSDESVTLTYLVQVDRDGNISHVGPVDGPIKADPGHVVVGHVTVEAN